MMYGYNYDYGNSMTGSAFPGIFMGIFWLAVVIGIVALVLWSIRHASNHSHTPMPPMVDDACQIARVRYAKGEITKEEYDEVCQRLGA
ncbi:MAG: SHOCT domain-containing protein [Coriobacteriia bacterium]|nr:SHOCT domain-containing protein [Coriobacteriia bacterium]